MSDVRTWFAVQYGPDTDDDWADTWHGDRFDDIAKARGFVERYGPEFAARGDGLRIVKRTEELITD